MADSTSVIATLREMISVSPSDEATFTRAMETYLSSEDVSVQNAACDAFVQLLEEGDGGTRDRRRALLLEDTALTYMPLLLPLSLIGGPSVPRSLSLISQYGRPREVVLGLTEALQYMVERAEGFAFNDEGQDERGEVDEKVESVSEWLIAISEFELILIYFKTAIPRLPNARSTPTLLSVSEAISLALDSLSSSTKADSSRGLIQQACELIDVIWEWVQPTSDAGGEQRNILCNLLYHFVAGLGYKVNAGLTERWFLATYPRFGGPQTTLQLSLDGEDGWGRGAMALERARKTAHLLDLSDRALFDKIVNISNITIQGSIASLILLAAESATSNELFKLLPSPLPANLLGDFIPIISVALGGSASDAGAVWTWKLIHLALQEKSKGGSVVLEDDDAVTLFESLIPLTAQWPSPVMRQALFKLIGAVVSLHSSSSEKIQLLKQLLDPANPFDNIRIQSFSLLREEIVASPTLVSSELLVELSPVFFLSTPNQDSPFTFTPPDLLNSPYPTLWTEIAMFVWFLSTRDTSDETRLKSEYKDRIGRWLTHTERKMEECRRFLDESEAIMGYGQGFVLARWEDSLHRAKAAMGL
ncbi:hypothetical protein IAR55_004893 [Kwoniella newhampshirensis]|uniref:Neurochondrin-domain-containing protein n=1 Tax=Kwoniella newhampshirensis TaxID=1651941 RepID=A0AAW0YW96_9TREE